MLRNSDDNEDIDNICTCRQQTFVQALPAGPACCHDGYLAWTGQSFIYV